MHCNVLDIQEPGITVDSATSVKKQRRPAIQGEQVPSRTRPAAAKRPAPKSRGAQVLRVSEQLDGGARGSSRPLDGFFTAVRRAGQKKAAEGGKPLLELFGDDDLAPTEDHAHDDLVLARDSPS